MHVRALLILTAFGLLIYSNSFDNSFHFDDYKVISANESIRDAGNPRAVFDAFNTRFLTGWTLAANYAMGALDVRGYHVFNWLTHVFTAFFVYLLVMFAFRTPALRDLSLKARAPAVALAAALIFLVHPVQTQSVNYIWQRAALLAAFFHLAGLLFYIHARLTGRTRFFVFAWMAAFVGMFTKETMVLFPATLLLFEVFFFREEGSAGKRYLRLLPFFAACLVVPLLMTRAGEASLQLMRPQVAEDFTRFVDEKTMPRGAYLLTQLPVLASYLRLLVFPAGLNLDPDFPIYRSFSEPAVWSSALLLAVLAVAAVLSFRKNRIFSFSITWFFLLLSLESLVPQNDVLLEHRLYLATAPAAFFVSAQMFVSLKRGAWPLVVLIVAVFSVMTYQRNLIWKNDIVLWTDVLRHSPGKARPYNNRGMGFFEAGRYEEAVVDFKKALELKDSYAEVHVNLGIALDRQDRLEEAVEQYSKALAMDPGYAKAYNNRGVDQQIQKKYDLAIADLTRAVELKPNYSQAFNNRGNCYQALGRLEEALEDYRQALRADATNAGVYFNRGTLYLTRRQPRLALDDFERMLRLKPGFSPAMRAREAALSRLNEAPSPLSRRDGS